MSLLRQFSLAAMLVAGTALAVTAYLDTQHGTPSNPGRTGGPILELGPRSLMSRPVRAAERGPLPSFRYAERSAEAAPAPFRTARRVTVTVEASAPAPGVLSEVEEIEIEPAGAVRGPGLR